MGYVIIRDMEGRVLDVLGDINQARRMEGLPHHRDNSFYSEDRLDEIDLSYNGETKKAK